MQSNQNCNSKLLIGNALVAVAVQNEGKAEENSDEEFEPPESPCCKNSPLRRTANHHTARF